MAEYAVEVNNIKKSFYLSKHKNDSIKSAITQVFKKKNKGKNEFSPLNGVSFTVEKGDFFGILGRNGSGKSTLLKIISEIYQPTSGSVKHNGRVVSFIELGVGFKSELSGRENVYLNGALLGFSKKEIDAIYDDIVDFAELEKFMDQKLKNYSSGMKVRLAFSVAIRAKADILILDEVLAVGDAEFRRKCSAYFETLKESGKTIILVTHSMADVRKYCNKAIVIEDGKVIYDGNNEGAADKYNSLFSRDRLPKVSSYANDAIKNNVFDIKHSEESINLKITTEAKYDIEDVVLAILIYKGSKSVFRWVSDENIEQKIDLKKNMKSTSTVKIQNIFPPGKYSISIMIRSRDRSVDYGLYDSIAMFENVVDEKYPYKTLWVPRVDYKNEK